MTEFLEDQQHITNKKPKPQVDQALHREIFGEFGDDTSEEEEPESNRITVIASSELSDFNEEESRLQQIILRNFLDRTKKKDLKDTKAEKNVLEPDEEGYLRPSVRNGFSRSFSVASLTRASHLRSKSVLSDGKRKSRI